MQDVFLASVLAGDIAKAAELIKQDADTHIDGGRVIVVASNSLPIVKYLLQKGVRINDISKPETTALDWARGNKKIYKYLKKRGAKSGQE